MGKVWSDFMFTTVRFKENDIREVNTRVSVRVLGVTEHFSNSPTRLTWKHGN